MTRARFTHIPVDRILVVGNCANHGDNQLPRSDGMRSTTRTVIRMLEKQPSIFLVNADRVVDDRRLSCMIDKGTGEVARTCKESEGFGVVAMPSSVAHSLDGTFAALSKHELVG